MNGILQFFAEQTLGFIVPLIVTAIIGWLGVLYTKVTGRQMEAVHRQALQSALENGIRGAIQMLLAGKLNPDGTVPEAKRAAVLAHAADYVTKSVPDAVKHFEITPTSLTALLMPKLPISIDKGKS